MNMAYSRKYRPKSMNDYMGDRIKKAILARFKDENNLPQVILLSGPRGNGKTSMARLLAKEYLCQDKTDGHACGKCWKCEEVDDYIENGTPIEGVMEMNIASDNGKQAIESMLEEAMIPPMAPLKYKILIMDECHMASASAQNALLKIVEEPPEHLVIIFATTDPEKMITPLRSRCQLSLEVRRPSIEELANRLLYVCQQEGIVTSLSALKIIAKKSGRIPREALNLLEQIAVESSKRVTLENTQAILGDISTELYMSFYDACNNKVSNVEALIKFIDGLKEKDIKLSDFMNGLIRFTLDCTYVKYGMQLDDFSPEFVKAAKKYFDIYNAEELDCVMQILEYAVRMMSSDDTRTELIIMTTGLRIGKTKKLALGLTRSNIEAATENNMSVNNHKQAIKDEIDKQSVQVVREVDDDILQAVFGAGVTEVQAGDTVPVITEESESAEENENDADRDVLDFLKN